MFEAMNMESSIAQNKTIHPGENPYHCFDYGTLRDFSHFKPHGEIPPGENYESIKDTNAFIISIYLAVHRMQPTREKSYEGSEYVTALNSILYLKKRKNSHKRDPSQCSKLGRALQSYTSIRLYMRTHTEEKPFKCDQ